jgi:hypothetical protein
MEKQFCKYCQTEKDLEEFSKGSNPIGKNYKCRLCNKKYKADNKERIKETRRKYNEKNAVKIAKQKKEYNFLNKEKFYKITKALRNKNSEKHKKHQKEYNEDNKEKIAEQKKFYNNLHREKLNIFRNKGAKERRLVDPLYKLGDNLRKRLWHAFKGVKSKKTLVLLGAPIEEIKLHLELTFTEGMNWENHGSCGKGINCDEVWHIDHIIPLSSADTEEALEKLCHYTNLQALWATDNLSKGASIN